MDNQIDSRGNLLTDGKQGHIQPGHHCHRFQARNRVAPAVSAEGRQRTDSTGRELNRESAKRCPRESSNRIVLHSVNNFSGAVNPVLVIQ